MLHGTNRLRYRGSCPCVAVYHHPVKTHTHTHTHRRERKFQADNVVQRKIIVNRCIWSSQQTLINIVRTSKSYMNIHEINANIELELAQEQFQNNIVLSWERMSRPLASTSMGVCRERLNLFLQERVIFRTTPSADSSPHMLTNNVSFAKHYQVSQCEKQLFACWHGNTPRERERPVTF